MSKTPSARSSSTRRRLVRLGFLALTDAAPLIAAQELSIFVKHGLDVQLSREIGWATVRDKIIYGELDAAPAPAPMLWSTRLGLDCASCPVLTSLVISMHGNAVTLSRRLWEAGVRDAEGLRTEAKKRRQGTPLVFGVVHPYSAHHLLLLHWLRQCGLDPTRDARIVIVPPAQTLRNLAVGTLDGYCAGEPWGSLAVQSGDGWCPAHSASLSPGHLEKVLMVREDFAQRHSAEHQALVSALEEAAAWCNAPANRPAVARLLSRRAYLNTPEQSLLPALTGRFDDGRGSTVTVPDFLVFAQGASAIPQPKQAAALQAELIAAKLVPVEAIKPELPGLLFQRDFSLTTPTRPTFQPHEPTPTLSFGALSPLPS